LDLWRKSFVIDLNILFTEQEAKLKVHKLLVIVIKMFSNTLIYKLNPTYLDSIGSTINLSKETTGPFTTCNLTESMQYFVAFDAAENPTSCAAKG